MKLSRPLELVRRIKMKKYSMSSKQIIRWIFINYGLFILAFFSLGFMSNIKSVVVINFVLDVILCAVSVILNIKLFSTKYKTPIVGKIGLLSTTLCFGLFTYFAFLMPQNGLPAALFSWFAINTEWIPCSVCDSKTSL